MKKAIAVVSLVLMAGLAFSLVGLAQHGLAELHVQKIVLEPPSSVTRGEDVQVYARITNTGSRNADSFSVGLFYRPSREGESWILLGTRQEANLGPSQQEFLEVTFGFPTTDMELGAYEIKVVADVSNQIPEVDELNNELATTMVIVTSTLGHPELQPVGLSFEQIGSSEMDPWRMNLTVENTGEYLLSSFDVRFLVNGEPLAIPIDPATPFIPDTGATTTVIGTLDPHSLGLDPGTYLITAIIDSAEKIAEQDEGNNSISVSLTIQTLELHPESLRFDRSIVRMDEEVRLTSEIANTGNGLAKNVQVDYYVGHLRFATTEIAQLGSVPVEVSVTLDGERFGLTDAPKVYEIRVVVDPDNAMSESDEANNELMRTLTILPPQVKVPELHPESLELTPASPAELGRADAVTVTSVIKNTGRADAESFDMGFYYRVKGGRRWESFPCSDNVSCGGLSLAAGAQATLVGVLPVLVLPPGIYEIRVAADSTNLIDELDEANNELVTTLTLVASRLPDLIVEIDSIEPGIALQHGQTARLSATISNIGELPSAATTVRFSYCKLVEVGTAAQQQATCSDGYKTTAVLPEAEVAIPQLGIGQATMVQVNVETGFLGSGQHGIRAEVDPRNQVEERNELNNIGARTLTVQGPDLVVLPGSFVADPGGTVNQEQVGEIGFRLTVANAGPLAAGEFSVAFELLRLEDGIFESVRGQTCGDVGFDCADPPYFGVVTLPGIGAGALLPVACTLDLTAGGLEPGQYVARVNVDCVGDFDQDGICDGRVSEHIEINNSAELLLTIVGGSTADGASGDFDLSVSSANGRSNPGRVLAYGAIKNVGVSTSGTFAVTIEAVLPSGQVLRHGVVGLGPLAAGEQISVDRNFLEGIDFSGLLAVGDRVDVAIRILTNDGNPDNNVATRRLTVGD